MSRYVLRRLGFTLLTALVTSLLIFAATRWLPGDVCRVLLGREAGPNALEACRRELGLARPAPVQYLSWLGDFLAGDWGDSYSTRLPIRPVVMERLENSLLLAALTLAVAAPVGVFLGALAGLNENRFLDVAISVLALAVAGLPEFVSGLALIQLFAFGFRRWGLPSLPANSSLRPGAGLAEALPMLALPALTATLVLLAYIARLTRAGVLEEMKRPYVRTAILKGLPRRRVIFGHVLRNALLPTITVIAISFGWLVSGLVVIENVFNYPGLGRLLVFAIDRRDFPLLQAVTTLAALGIACANLVADLVYAALNPRIRYG